MTSKKILKMNMPEVNLYIVTVGIASIFLLYYNFYIGVLFFIGFLYMVINNWKTTNIRRKEWTNYIQNLSAACLHLLCPWQISRQCFFVCQS